MLYPYVETTIQCYLYERIRASVRASKHRVATIDKNNDGELAAVQQWFREMGKKISSIMEWESNSRRQEWSGNMAKWQVIALYILTYDGRGNSSTDRIFLATSIQLPQTVFVEQSFLLS